VPFGGKVVVLGGDLRQTLPVVQGGSRAEIIRSAIIYSSLWAHVTVIHLTVNMRLKTQGLTDEGRKELAKFSKWMLDIDEGKIDATAKQDETEPSWIKIPEDLLLKANGYNIACIVDAIYPGIQSMHMDATYLRERAILTPTNDIAETINSHMVSLVPNEEKH
jgi:ATP-dependent DNA helicase PIF1